MVGGGICGLAAAHELARRDVRVLVVERTGVGAEQSAGLARIFRIAHVDARLCALALEARDGWRRWAERLGTGRLLGDEGVVAAGRQAIERQAPAMESAGATWRALDGAEVARRIGPAGDDDPWPAGVLDPLGGAVRVQRALRALSATVEVRRGEVLGAEDRGQEAVVHLADGARLRADRVLVCAGVGVPALAATAGIVVPVRFTRHVRLTYGWSRPVAPSACFTSPSAYGLPLGRTGRFAVGLEDPGEPAPLDTTDGDAFACTVRGQHADWLPHHLPGLEPHPVGEVRCVSVHAPWLDDHDDGFAALRQGRVVAFAGSNLMKFAPVLGDRLARTVLAEDGVHEDLAPAMVA